MKRQKSIAGHTTGSFINYMMGNNSTLPEVGKGCTLLSWTDRHAYEVLKVSADGKRVEIQQYLPERVDNNGMSECQDYKFEKLNGFTEVIVWRWNAWRKEIKKIVFTKDFSKRLSTEFSGNKFYGSAEWNECYPNGYDLALVPGKTEIKMEYSKVNVLWGVKEEYYDYSF